MRFPEYLKERISEDYKNLIIRKLEEIKEQTQQLTNSIYPAFSQKNTSLKDLLQKEMARVQEVLESELNGTQEKISGELNTILYDYMSSWYHSDISPFQQQLDLLISDIISNVPTKDKKENPDVQSLSELFHRFDQANTQSDILNLLLQHIARWVDRAVLFVVKEEKANGWAAVGLEPDWDKERIRRFNVSLGKDHILRQVVKNGEGEFSPSDQYPDNAELFEKLGNTSPKTILAYPIIVRGKIAGIIYADIAEELSDRPDVPNLLYLASRSAGFAIDLLPMKPKTARATEDAKAAPSLSESAEIPIKTIASAPSEVKEAEPEESGEGTVIMPAFRPSVLTEDDEKLHEDAKRFARLLVSEIKLYNEAQVSAGREHKDLYERLREDIERSRRMYQERIPGHIQSSTNYFFEELVRTLADGDPSLLGM